MPIAARVAPGNPATRNPMKATVMTDRPRGDHRHGDRVEELLLGQPAVPFDDALAGRKGTIARPAAEDEGSRPW
jgi:hypothetical protein